MSRRHNTKHSRSPSHYKTRLTRRGVSPRDVREAGIRAVNATLAHHNMPPRTA